MSCAAAMMSSKPIVVDSADSFAWSRSVAMRRQASRRSALRRHHRIDAEQRDAAQDERRDAGRQVHAPARPQAATAPP